MFLQHDHSIDLSDWNDEELWNFYLQGRQRALGGLFLRYHTRLFQYGIKLVGNDETVLDSIQELFLKLWKNRENIDFAISVEFYLLLSFRRLLLSQKSQRETLRKREEKYLELVPHSLPSIEESMIAREAESERYEKFREAVQSLTDRQKEVLYLRLHHGMTNHEISMILNLSVQRVKNYVYETTKKLREHIFKKNMKENITER